MRTRILGKMLNSEVQDYLSRNDIIIVPVGTTEMHGGFPLDCETVISEAYALKAGLLNLCIFFFILNICEAKEIRQEKKT